MASRIHLPDASTEKLGGDGVPVSFWFSLVSATHRGHLLHSAERARFVRRELVAEDQLLRNVVGALRRALDEHPDGCLEAALWHGSRTVSCPARSSTRRSTLGLRGISAPLGRAAVCNPQSMVMAKAIENEKRARQLASRNVNDDAA